MTKRPDAAGGARDERASDADGRSAFTNRGLGIGYLNPNWFWIAPLRGAIQNQFPEFLSPKADLNR